jgi:hypothetical protein
MKKSILYRLFGLGAIPVKARPVLEAEEIVVSDEGMSGWLVTRDVTGPGRRYRQRREGFSGCLVITGKRLICFTHGKRQINVSVNDPRLSALVVNAPDDQTLSISFESSLFQEGWQGIIEFRFNTEKAQRFQDVLGALGARKAAPEDGRRAAGDVGQEVAP